MIREGRRRTQAFFSAVLDAAAVLTAMALAWFGRFDFNQWLAAAGLPHFDVAWHPQSWPYALAAPVTIPACWLVFRAWGLYEDDEDTEGEWFRVGAATLTAALLLGAFGFYTKLRDEQQQFLFSRAYALLFFAFSWPTVCAFRAAFRAVLRTLARRGFGRRRVLFIGEGSLTEELARALSARGTVEVVGTLSAPEYALKGDGTKSETKPEKTTAAQAAKSRLRCLGRAEELATVVERTGADEVLAVLPEAPPAVWRVPAEECWRLNVGFRVVPGAADAFFAHTSISLIDDVPVLSIRGSRIEGVNYAIKRLFDLAVSAALLTLASPLFLFAALGIRLTDGRPIFYYQERLGRRRRPFRMWKFRSMRRGAEQEAAAHRNYLKKYIAGEAEARRGPDGAVVYKLADDPRVTPFGRLLRRYSLDELPQLWNVLKGEMSLIGPRPPLSYEVREYRPLHYRRFEALPGISGLWQVSGRNSLSFEEMVELDLYYLENWSFELDLRILFKTIRVVLFQKAV